MRVRAALPPVLTAALLLPLLPGGQAVAATAAPRVIPAAEVAAPAVLTGSGLRSPSVVSKVRRFGLQSSARSRATTATFSVTYTGFSPAQRDAFQAAVDTWAQVLTSPVPITIDAHMSALPEDVLGEAGPTHYVVHDGNGRYDTEDTLLPVALANVVFGRDVQPGSADITAEFSNDPTLFSYGSTAVRGTYDFTTVVLHEIGHGLGFAGAMDVRTDASGTKRGYWDVMETRQPRPMPYDRRTVSVSPAGTVSPLLGLGRGSTQLAEALTTGRALWNGPSGVAANGGVRPELYTPAAWEEGSSYSHLDEDTFPPGDPDSLMTPKLDLGEVVRDPGDVALAMLSDLGWRTDARSLRLSGPSSVRAGATVTVAGAAPRGTTVHLYFKRRGSTRTSPGAAPGFVLQRRIAVGAAGAFRTTYVANDDHRYYASVGEQVSDGVLTQVRPTLAGPASRVVRRGSRVSVAGRGLPATTLQLRFRRARGADVLRTVRVAPNGTWSRTQVLDSTLRVSARGANGMTSDTTVLLQAR